MWLFKCYYSILTDSNRVISSCAADFLREDTSVGTSFLRAAAHDADQGSNAAITYSLSNQKPAYLEINPSTGWVYVNHPISQVRDVSLHQNTVMPSKLR